MGACIALGGPKPKRNPYASQVVQRKRLHGRDLSHRCGQGSGDKQGTQSLATASGSHYPLQGGRNSRGKRVTRTQRLLASWRRGHVAGVTDVAVAGHMTKKRENEERRHLLSSGPPASCHCDQGQAQAEGSGEGLWVMQTHSGACFDFQCHGSRDADCLQQPSRKQWSRKGTE